jgi:hypothetical protein
MPASAACTRPQAPSGMLTATECGRSSTPVPRSEGSTSLLALLGSRWVEKRGPALAKGRRKEKAAAASNLVRWRITISRSADHLIMFDGRTTDEDTKHKNSAQLLLLHGCIMNGEKNVRRKSFCMMMMIIIIIITILVVVRSSSSRRSALALSNSYSIFSVHIIGFLLLLLWLEGLLSLPK